MNASEMRVVSDDDLARDLARRAGALLLALRDAEAHEARALGDAGDREANDFLLKALAIARPADAVLSEESLDDLARLNAHRTWIIDPLDGTREFREGRNDWAVHVALVEAHRVMAAAVAIPSRDEVFSTSATHAPAGPIVHAHRVVISRSRPPAFAAHVASALDAALVQVGSAGAKAMMVVRGDALAYVHDGGMNEWDAAAPVGVALAHGLHVSTLRGDAIRFNQRDVVLCEGLVICAKEIAQRVMDAL